MLDQNFSRLIRPLLPQVTRFVSITHFLRAYYDFRKERDEKFSYEIWSQELGFKSRSSVRMMAFGKKNISERFIAAFGQKLGLSAKEKQYLNLLCRLKTTTNLELKTVFLEKMLELSDAKINKTEIANTLEFLSSPDLCVLHIIISFEDFHATIKNIRQVLQISLPRIEKALEKLEKFALVEKHANENSKDCFWKSNVKFFSITREIEGPALDVFHYRTARELKEIIDQNIEDKKMKSLYFSLTKDDYVDLAETLEQFSTRLKNKYANDFINGKKLYKVNMQAYPVTEKFEICPESRMTISNEEF